MADALDIKFDDLQDPKEVKSINKAGVHRGFELSEKEFLPSKEKDGKKTNPMVKIVLKGEDGQFTIYRFTPPTKEEDVKYCGKKFKDGVEIGKRTPAEEIQEQFKELFYFWYQLGMALKFKPADLAKLKQVTGKTDVLFQKLYDEFFKIAGTTKDKKIDFKCLWNNNDKDKTSFLNLAKATANNIVFATHFPEASESTLQISQYEEKLLNRKYTANDRAPKSNATVIDGGEGTNALGQSTEVSGAADEDLF